MKKAKRIGMVEFLMIFLLTTAYESNFEKHIIPFFEREYPDLLLEETERSHIQHFVSYERTEGRLKLKLKKRTI